MPETKLKSLHVGKSISDLKEQYNISEAIKGKKAKMLCLTAHRVYDEAGKHRLSGDEEMSYIFYMKYLTIVTMIQGSDEYKKDKEYVVKMLGKDNVNVAMNMAEKLSESLEQRYKLMKEQEEIEEVQRAQEQREAEEELKRNQVKIEKPADDTRLVNGMPGENEVSISSSQLYSLLKDNKTNILILDSRPASCYAESHMNIGNCINVPEEIVKPGASAAALEKSLPSDSKSAWSKRRDADLVVLLDWSTSGKTLQQGTNLYTLKNILLKWDPGIIYKTDPLILEGGYEDWLLTYPMHSTNPHVKPPIKDKHSGLDDLLDDVEYPNILETANLVPLPLVDRSSKPHAIRRGSASADKMNIGRMIPVDSVSGGQPRVTGSSSDRTGNVAKPVVDRGSKAAVLQMYEERSRLLSEMLNAKENKSQELEAVKVKAEKDWEILRMNKEKEADEEIVRLLQEKEEKLLREISQLKERQQTEVVEKQHLKEQLEQFKKMHEEEMKKLQNQNKVAEAKDEEERKKLVKEQEEQRERERKASEERQRVKDAARAKKLEEEKRKEKDRERQEHDKGTYYTQLRSDMPSSSSMKRSHSSPNIAQMMDELDLDAKHKAPHFDRTIKPLQKPQPSDIKAARQRNFNAVYGNMGGRGLTGLKNLGNSCYMNSIIQCINHTTPLAFYFCEGVYREDVNHNNSTRGEVAEEVAAVVRALWCGQYRSIACRDLKIVVGQHRKQFQGYEQQDSHEFFTILMDWLHEDLSKQTRNSPLKEASNENMSPADRAWEKFQRSNESLIRTLFYGQQKSSVRCCKCGEESVTFEAFSDLSLPIPISSNKCSLAECMKLYLNGERISGWNCPSCKEKREAIKKFDILKLPPILVIHLNRFYHDGWWRKRQAYVDFPFSMDMRQYTLVPNQRYGSYNLYGVSNHYGTMEGGHYTAYCKNSTYCKWFKFDDHEVSEISSNEVRSGAAYILFYASIEYKVPGNS
ncbi:ubiquitin carboxyl-terminal hydrolase 8 isoform X2 [Periplaneta americana]|uniref:ubiquitin carboxyl-terminal hydrolase 8 isoform X2 n=1 Tax=Periplaneta americana TaxID=6978 RepID=UPI0037E9ADB2